MTKTEASGSHEHKKVSGDQEVADRIVDVLRARALLDETKLKQIRTRLGAGEMSAPDWTLLFENIDGEEGVSAGEDS